MFVALIQATTFSWRHTKTHADSNRCHSETVIDQQQHSCETLICQRHQTILRLLSSANTPSTRWRVSELYCPTTYVQIRSQDHKTKLRYKNSSATQMHYSCIHKQIGRWLNSGNACYCRSQWPRGLRRRSLAARLLRLWVRIPPGAWTFVCCECCVFSGRGLCDGLIIRSEESYRMWRVVVCDQETS